MPTLNKIAAAIIIVTGFILIFKGVNGISTIPAVSDINGDGIDDLIFAAGSYYVGALSGRTLSLLWAYKIEPFSRLREPERYSSPVISDFNGDNIPDVAISWVNGKIIALNGKSGALLWEHNTEDTNRIISSLALADFNKDTVMDVVVAGENGKVLILDGKYRAEKRVLATKNVTDNKISATPLVGDIDADGYKDIIITSCDNIHLLTTPTRVFFGEIFWESFRRDAKNSATLFYVSRSGTYQAYAGLGAVMILGKLFLTKMAKKKKLAKCPKIVKLG